MDEKDLDRRRLEQTLATLSDELAGLKNTLRNGNGGNGHGDTAGVLIWKLVGAISILAAAFGGTLYFNMRAIDDRQNSEIKELIQGQAVSTTERLYMFKILEAQQERLNKLEYGGGGRR